MFLTDNQKKELKEWIKTIIFAILIYLIVSVFIFSVRVDGSSMNPTFKHGDFLFATRSYLNGTYERGDVVVFEYTSTGSEKALIKRIIGVPGDIVSIQNQEVYINGQKIDEPYINNPPLETMTIEVTDGNYFVMGDNRQNSLDSRYESVGLIPAEKIMGKVVVEIFPKPQIIK